MPVGGTAEPLGFQGGKADSAPAPVSSGPRSGSSQCTSHLPALNLSTDVSPQSLLTYHLPKGAGPLFLGS